MSEDELTFLDIGLYELRSYNPISRNVSSSSDICLDSSEFAEHW
jgi:hypothetical protein